MIIQSGRANSSLKPSMVMSAELSFFKIVYTSEAGNGFFSGWLILETSPCNVQNERRATLAL